MYRWKELERNVEKGPASIGWKVFWFVVIFSVGSWGVGSLLGWFGEAQQVAREEFGPRAMLTKYEWFKDASAQLDSKKANISMYASRLDSMKSTYGETPRKDWDRTDKDQFNLWNMEVSGMIASYNGLSAEWNSQISKFNWKPFLADLPEGAEQVLTTEYREYTYEM